MDIILALDVTISMMAARRALQKSQLTMPERLVTDLIIQGGIVTIEGEVITVDQESSLKPVITITTRVVVSAGQVDALQPITTIGMTVEAEVGAHQETTEGIKRTASASTMLQPV